MDCSFCAATGKLMGVGSRGYMIQQFYVKQSLGLSFCGYSGYVIGAAFFTWQKWGENNMIRNFSKIF